VLRELSDRIDLEKALARDFDRFAEATEALAIDS
jgi:hypothetical protein